MSWWEDITGVTAANTAAAQQQAATEAAIAEQRGQRAEGASQRLEDIAFRDAQIAKQEGRFGEMQSLMSPYIQAGQGAIEQQQALSGALGPEAQQAAISAIQAGPGFQAALQQGETSMLQNAAATGGVRGGNTQGALAQFSPQLLGQAIDQRYAQLGGLAGMGQASAAGVGQAGLGVGQAGQVGRTGMSPGIANSLQMLGNQQAAGTLGAYNLQQGFGADLLGGLLGIGGLGVNIAKLF